MGVLHDHIVYGWSLMLAPQEQPSSVVLPDHKSLCLLHGHPICTKGCLQSYLRLQPHLHFYGGLSLGSGSTERFLSRFTWFKYAK